MEQDCLQWAHQLKWRRQGRGCDRWNSGKLCANGTCKFDHVCNKCGRDHPAIRCLRKEVTSPGLIPHQQRLAIPVVDLLRTGLGSSDHNLVIGSNRYHVVYIYVDIYHLSYGFGIFTNIIQI